MTINRHALTPSDVKVARSYPATRSVAEEPTNHPHQKGLGMGVEHLSGTDVWENDSSCTPRMGRIVFKDLTKDGRNRRSPRAALPRIITTR